MKRFLFLIGVILSIVSTEVFAQPAIDNVPFGDDLFSTELTGDNDEILYRFDVNKISFQLNVDNVQSEIGYLMEKNCCDECIAELNEEWFTEFMLLQEKGLSMKEADELALTSASFVFKLCNITDLAMMH